MKIKVQTIFSARTLGTPADVIISVNGKKVAKGTVELTIPLAFTASETFDVGIDLGASVSLDHLEMAPFKFEGGAINDVHITY